MTAPSPAGGQPAEGGSSEPPGYLEAQAIRAAVLACPDVAELSAGALGEVASYFSGRRVPGIRVGPDTVEVHIVAVYGRSLRDVADDLDRTLAPLLRGRRLQVVVTDILLPGETLDAATDGERAASGGR